MLVPLLAVVASALVWVWVYRSTVGHPLDPMALTLYYLALQLLARPLTFALGLDTPFPSELFADRPTGSLVVTGQAVVVLWLLALWAGARLLPVLVGPTTLLFPRVRAALGPRTLLLVTVALTLVAFAVTVSLWARYGGPAGLIEAAKVDRDVSVRRALRSVPLLATLFGVAALFSAPRGALLQRSTALACVVANGYLSWTWGARDVAVVSVVALLAGSLVFGETGRRAEGNWLRDRRWRWQLLLVPVLALVVAFSLRAARDSVLWGELAPSIGGDQSTVRMVAVATNLTFYDSLLLLLDDWPEEQDFRGGADFIDGTVAAAPTVLAGEQEPFLSPAAQLARTYLDRNNGFPATAVGDWYVNLGLLGVAVGGALSGLVARAGQVALHRFRRDPLVWGFSLILMVRVFPGGVWATSSAKWVAIGVPLIAVGLLINLVARRDDDEDAGPPPPARPPGRHRVGARPTAPAR
ncbi:hypothetical protein [Modestobacter sp. I12A-02662]|uniref:hypothetical protein n=1 Tax=Modestobacter sp. I12A-02662 TaxID=1730496 RepID=UPI0034DFBFF6